MLSGGGFRKDKHRFRCRYRSILGYQNHRDRGIGWGEVEAGWWSASNLIGDLVDKVEVYGIVAAWSSIAATRSDCRNIIKSVETEIWSFRPFPCRIGLVCCSRRGRW